eukprot:superscaffoldBa00000562_g5655
MSSVECLREFINERLTTAAEEIFGVFQKTIVQYEEEIDRQRRLLDIVWKPEIKLNRIELPQQHACKEGEVLADQQLCNQDRNSSLDQEDPEPPQIKEEQEELCTSLKGEQLVLKQETETLMWTPTFEESDNSEGRTEDSDETQSAAEKEHIVIMSVRSLVVPEPNSDDQLLSHNSHVAESQDHKGGKQGDSGSIRNTETKPHHNSNSHTDNEHNSTMLKINNNTRKIECLRELINERLTAAAEEIFRVFQKTVVQYEEEIDRQRRLLDIVWKPEIKLYRIELPQQHVCKEEEDLPDQQFCNQERNSSLDQEDPEPPQIREEQEELYTSLEGEQLVLKQETETFMLTPCEESDNSEDQTLDLSPDETQSAAEKEHVVIMSLKSLVVPDPNSDDQFLSHNSPIAESQDHKGGKQGDSGSTGNAEIKPQKRHQKS